MTTRIETIDHNHIMVYDCTIINHCNSVEIHICKDPKCGYFEPYHAIPNISNCNLSVMMYSTRVTCYKCETCGRLLNDS